MDEIVYTLTDSTRDATLLPLAHLLEKHGPLVVTGEQMASYEGSILRFKMNADDTVTVSLDAE